MTSSRPRPTCRCWCATTRERFLRQSDLVEGGRDDQFFHLAGGEAVEASRANLLVDHDPALDGEATVTLASGDTVVVRPLFVRLREVLAGYTPESTEETTGAHPDTVRTIARKVAGGRTRIVMGMGANKAYHSDLYQRTMNLLLGLTGNWGRAGAGINCWAATQIDGQLITGAKPVPGVEGAEMVLAGIDMMIDAIRAEDPTMTDELASLEMWRGGLGADGGGMVPPVFFWYWHAGFARPLEQPDQQRPCHGPLLRRVLRRGAGRRLVGRVAAPRP